MGKRDLIYIIIIIGLILTSWFLFSNYKKESISINTENTRLKSDVKELNRCIDFNEKEIDRILGKLAAGAVTIDSLKNIEHEIPTIIIDDIPVSQRNITIERLAAE